MKSMSLGRLGGTLYYKDIPLFKFKCERNGSASFTVLCSDYTIYPFEMMNGKLTIETLRSFFEARITPPTRQGINEYLATTPVQYYHPERIIRYSSGRCIHDNYWLECDDDNTCWK